MKDHSMNLISFFVTLLHATLTISLMTFECCSCRDSVNGDGKNVSLSVVTREEWNAQLPTDLPVSLVLPTKRIIITHTGTDSCSTQTGCSFRVRSFQTYHMKSRNWGDIGYNWIVGGDGQVYEGRGWTKQGIHTKGFNKGSVAIAFIGTFNRYKPAERQLEAAQLLIEEGVRLGMLDKKYKLYGHRQLTNTNSPGDILYGIIMTWPHWSKK